MVHSKFDSFLDVSCRSGVDPDYRHAPYLTRNAERGVEITGLDRPVGEGVCLVVGVLGSTG